MILPRSDVWRQALRVRSFAIDGNRQDCDPLTAARTILDQGRGATKSAQVPRVERSGESSAE